MSCELARMATQIITSASSLDGEALILTCSLVAGVTQDFGLQLADFLGEFRRLCEDKGRVAARVASECAA